MVGSMMMLNIFMGSDDTDRNVIMIVRECCVRNRLLLCAKQNIHIDL